MSDFRVQYGMALGQYGPASSVSGGMLFPANDATPDVSSGTFFLTNNANATAVTYFDVQGPGGLTSLNHNGKVVKILVNDNNTTFVNGGRLFLPGTGAAMTSGTIVEFVYYNSGWYCTNLTENLRSDVQNVTVAGTGAPSVADARLLIITGTGGSTAVITGLSGGYPGQIVSIAKIATAVITDSVCSLLTTTDFILAGTSALTMNGSSVYTFICDVPPRFRMMSDSNVRQ